MNQNRKEPWHYRVTASIPHRDTPDMLAACVELLKRQNDPPYIHVIDTGSRPEVLPAVQALACDSVEVHCLSRGRWRDPHQIIAAAIDLSMSMTQTERHYTTHVDVLHKRKDHVERMAAKCDARRPVVGYEMSERSWITDQWRGMVGHTSTCLYMPTMRTIGAMWNLEYAYRMLGKTVGAGNGWPDTETGFNTILRRACVDVYLVGHETNDPFYEDENLIHLRSYTYKLYKPWQDVREREKYLQLVKDTIARVLESTK